MGLRADWVFGEGEAWAILPPPFLQTSFPSPQCFSSVYSSRPYLLIFRYSVGRLTPRAKAVCIRCSRQNGRGRRRLWPACSTSSSVACAGARGGGPAVLHEIRNPKTLGQQRAAFRQMYRPLHGALQLPGIAGPRVAEDRLRPSPEARGPGCRFRRSSCRWMKCSASGRISSARSRSGRHEDAQGADPVREIRPELALRNGLLEILVGRGDDAEVHGYGAQTRPSRWISPDWSTRSSLTCMSKGISPISSRNSVPVSASSNLPGRPPFLRSRERAFLIAEQLALQKPFGNGPAL